MEELSEFLVYAYLSPFDLEKIQLITREELSEVLVKFNSDSEFISMGERLHDTLDKHTILTSTRLLGINEGLYGYDSLEKENESSLKEKLSSEEDRGVFYSMERNIRYAPRNTPFYSMERNVDYAIMNTRFFQIGYQIKNTLEENSVMRAIANEKGAQNLAILNKCLPACETYMRSISENPELVEEQKHFIVGFSIRDDDDYGYEISIQFLREDTEEFVYGIKIID